jgi:hypothetical protein
MTLWSGSIWILTINAFGTVGLSMPDADIVTAPLEVAPQAHDEDRWSR